MRFEKWSNLIGWELISWEPDFSQTCGFRWIMKDTELNRFKTRKYTCLTTILEKVLFRFDMGMPGHVWADMWHHRINLWLLLNKVYHHAKFGCIYLRSSWDIEIWKMGQSDWLRAFFKISREPDFSQTCRITSENGRKIFRLVSEKNTFSKESDFSQKIGLRHFSSFINV